VPGSFPTRHGILARPSAGIGLATCVLEATVIPHRKPTWLLSIFVFGLVSISHRDGMAQESAAFPDASQLQIPGGAAAASQPTGEIDVWVSLVDASLGQASGRNAKRDARRAQQADYSRQVLAQQDAIAAQVAALGGREIARVRKAHNAIAVRIDASRVPDLAALPGVREVRPVRNYQVDLSETVPYIGAGAVQGKGVTGNGVIVAILDTGIDYTHRNLGGPGTLAAYAAAYGAAPTDPKNKTTDGLFPTAKVIGGFDFVGEVWPNGALSPDPDPIDFEGHGTHVSDIVAGADIAGTHRGVAPGASLIALKVCSSVSTSCSGIALLQAMDSALDPNGDDDLSDAVDVINMSLGSDYGQEQDDLSEASATAVDFGVVVVAAAGNAGNRPYIVSSPSIGRGVISVAQTHVPSALVIPLVINSPANIAGTYGNTATLDFAPVGAGVTGNVAFVGRGCPADSIAPGSPADAYTSSPAGKIALIDRGSCSISLKIDRAAKAGAIGVLIGLVAAGDAIPFSFGGGDTFVPTLVITQATSNLIKANIAAPVNVSISPASAVPLVSSIVSSSARGPSYSGNAIKPDIGAPGASVSAIARTGTGQEAFGGTSGATPMITGSAALLLQAKPSASPAQIKAALMNNAETAIFTNPALLPGVLAPITRIGAGEVRVDRALASTTTVWDNDENASLSFSYVAASEAKGITQHLYITNNGTKTRTYSIVAGFRYANDQASGAVTIKVPSSVQVQAGRQRSFPVTVHIDPAKLPTWNLNGGSNGGNGALLEGVEFDGYISITDADDRLRVPWHVLPHKAAAVTPQSEDVSLVNGTGTIALTNPGAVAGRVDVFALTGTSHKVHKKELPEPGDNFAVIDLKAVGVRGVTASGIPAIQFGITTNGIRSHPNYPAEFDVFIDNNRDGVFDFAIFNLENGGFAVTGQNIVGVADLKTNTAIARFFADADLDSGNFIATALLSDLGLTPTTQFDFSVVAFDNYFTGRATDAIENMTFNPSLPRFVGTGVPASGVPIGGTSTLTVQEVPGGSAASPSQTGLLLLYRDGRPKQESSIINVQ
jgi:minor extracellular serine protease Vpr